MPLIDVEVRGVGAHVRREGAVLELYTPQGSAELVVRHRIEDATHVWVPHLTPAAGNVMGDWVFRSPAVVVAGAAKAVAFVVDVDDVRQTGGRRVWLDYDHPARTLVLGAGAYRQEGHVLFARESATPDGPVSVRLHVLESDRPEDIENPYGLAARFCWERWGRSGFERAERPPVATHMDRIVRWAFSPEGWGDSVWLQVDETIGAPVFIVDVGRHPSIPPEKRTWRERPSIWNQAWFSTQRCANGLLRYARQTSSPDLERRARQMTEVAFAAPQTNGLFPAVREADGRWTNSDRRPTSVSPEACHIVDAAFTGRKLLEWDGLVGDARVSPRLEAFVQRLLALQRPSGAFPGWVEPDGRVAPELAEGPESAVSVALLFELSHTQAALRGARFLEGVAREGRWEDFETYYSCSRFGTPGAIVTRNGVYKQNTLSIAWSAEAFLLAWRATQDSKWLRLARRCIDELSLYQAVWSPPFLPAPAHGGFGVMNADAEWNDARQSLFAPLYLDMARAMGGDRELTERGVSALRASFAMLYCPENADVKRAYEERFPFFGPESYGFMMENQGHDVANPIGTFTIFTWGNGSALAAVATARDLFPDVAREHGLL